MPRRNDRPPGFVPEAEQEPGAGEPAQPRVRLFRGDEMSSGLSSSLRKRAGQVIGAAKPATVAAVGGDPLPPSEDPTRREIQKRAMQADLATKRPARGARAQKAKPAGDTFVRKKMRQAERNLPAWDPDEDP